MEMKVRTLDLDAGGKTIVVLNGQDAQELGVYSLDRVIITAAEDSLTAVVNTSDRFIPQGQIAVFDEVRERLCLATDQVVQVIPRGELLSKRYIRRKVNGAELMKEEIDEIISDVVERNLNDLELAAFITAIHLRGLSIEESTSLIDAMVKTGSTLSFGKAAYDKHSIGGVPGDKTSLLLVPVIAASGLIIPKTSSRAITSPSGTADRAEMLMPVNLDISEIDEVVKKTHGCLVWGGSLDLAPADDLLIQIEHPLGMDPLLLSSIISKKLSVGATHVVIDIPTGYRAKMKTVEDARRLSRQFIQLGEEMSMKLHCAITFGEQPIGHCIGPALEAREALEMLYHYRVSDLTEKVTHLAGILLNMAGKVGSSLEGKILAEDILQHRALPKMKEIIEAQGGNPDLRPEEIPVGDCVVSITTDRNGVVRWINNNELVRIASAAGCPKDSGAGIRLFKKLGDTVHAGDALLEIRAEKSSKLTQAEGLAHQYALMGIIDRWDRAMMLQEEE
ncbi:MAG: AMP phosphorylase [Theionarchaea archaeon]|nr:AMP phosphorylase [Theionarchaea archaeon]